MSRTVAIVITLLLVAAAAGYFRTNTTPADGSPAAAATDETVRDPRGSRPIPMPERAVSPGAAETGARLRLEAEGAAELRRVTADRHPAESAPPVPMPGQVARPDPLPVEAAMALEEPVSRPLPAPGPGPAVTDRGLAGPGRSSTPTTPDAVGEPVAPGNGVSIGDAADSAFVGPGPSQLDLGLPGPGQD